jgi:hypothetical protein
MLGYYAIPKRQDTDLKSCVDVDKLKSPEDKSPQVERYIDAVKGGLLVNTGDVFAPLIWSRQMYYPGGPSSPKGPDHPAGYYPKELFQFGPPPAEWILLPKDDTPPSETIPADNVGCFLRLAHFQAIVPGKHDFYFGPDNLRKLASMLAEPASGRFKPVQMLGANLYIQSTPAKSLPASPNTKERPFKTTLPANTIQHRREIAIAVPDVVHPSARVFHLTGTDPGDAKEFDHAGLYADSDDLNPESDAPLLMLGVSEGKSNTRTGSSEIVLPGLDLRSHIGTSMRICARHQKQWLCSAAFIPFQTLLQYSPGSTGPRPGDWAIYQNGAEKVAVMGVVDPNLLEHVGMLNYSWLNKKAALDTQVKVSDPVQALSQMIDSCDVDPECHGARIVVLAQMPPQTARVLAAHFQPKQVIAVISRADEDLATPSGTNSSALYVPPVLTPKPSYHRTQRQEDGLDLEPQETVISADAAGRTKVETTEARGHVGVEIESDGSRKLTLGTPKTKKPANAAKLEAAFGTQPPNASDADRTAAIRTLWEQAALEAMMAHCRSDIAMLQHRDVYAHPKTISFPPAQIPLQLRIDQALWKGDIAVCNPVTGATIKATLKDSDSFDKLDASNLAISEERGRGLATLGLMKVDDGYLVNGAAMDDKKLYSVAMTDYLVSGDTGYPELRTPAVPPAKRIRDYDNIIEVGVLLCRELQDDGCRDKLPRDQYFDVITLSAYGKQPASPTVADLWENYLKDNFLPASKKPSGAEDRPQNQPRTSLYLDKADYGLSYNTHTGSEKFITNAFTGVPIAQVTAKEQRTQTIDWSIRLTRSHRHFDSYAASDANYAQTQTRNLQAAEDIRAGEPFLLNQTKNQLNGEIGMIRRLVPFGYRSATGLKAFMAARVETQLVDPLVQFALGTSGFETEVFHQPRNYYVYSKNGLRWDGKKSWIEAGFGIGPKLHSLTGYTFTGLGKTSTCSIIDTSSCTKDLKDFGTTVAASPTPQALISNVHLDFATADRLQYGFFSNSKIALPIGLLKLPTGLGLTVENQTQFFFRRRQEDTIADTRYFSDFTVTLTVPLVGNLSLAPKVDLFFFRNKTLCAPSPATCLDNPNGAAMTGQQTSVTLKYSFDWHTGLPWRKVLRYANPSSLK